MSSSHFCSPHHFHLSLPLSPLCFLSIHLLFFSPLTLAPRLSSSLLPSSPLSLLLSSPLPPCPLPSSCLFLSLSIPFPQSLSPLLPQIQVDDPDEEENGMVTMALQVGMPRLDFYLNSTTGMLYSTATLDREQIGLYHLRIVGYDQGQNPRTSTSTLTITGMQ